MIVQGKQMIEVLNKCHISCACLGNHDFGKNFIQINLIRIKNVTLVKFTIRGRTKRKVKILKIAYLIFS